MLLHETPLKSPCPERRPDRIACLNSDSSVMRVEQNRNIASSDFIEIKWDSIAKALLADDAWKKSAAKSINSSVAAALASAG